MPSARPAVPASGSLLARGRAGLAIELTDARDLLIASDPGLFRLRRGLGALLGVGSTALVESWTMGLTGLHGQALVLPIMLGAVMAMVSATSVREPSRRSIAWVSLWLPVASAVGFTSGTLAHPAPLAAIGLFVLVSFLAVWVRRFGPRWFTRGFVMWQGYFFTLFIGPPISLLPVLLLSGLVSSAWVALLLVTVLFDAPRARLRRTVSALRARLRAAISACLELIESPGDPRAERRLRAQLVRASAVALMFDAQLGTEGALAAGLSASRLRRWLMELEIGLEDVAGATLELTRRPPSAGGPASPPVDDPTLGDLRTALRVLGWGELDAAQTLLQRLPDDAPAVRRLASGGLHLIDASRAAEQGRLADGSWNPAGADGEDDYEPVVSLIGDNLPGTAVLAGEAVSSGASRPWSPARWAFTTRQAVQAAVAAALAAGAGELISPRRYYWAAIAAFVTFTGAATAAETVRKALARTVGTLLGLAVALLLAEVSRGDLALTVGIGLVGIFAAFYFQPLSYAAMTFFITVVLGELYVLLHLFSGSVMVLRLEETAVGAAAGIVASFLVLPVPARATARVARVRLMGDMAALLDGCAERLWGLVPQNDPLAGMVEVTDAARQVDSTRSTSLRPLNIGTPSPAQQHYTTVLIGSAGASRAVAQWVLSHPDVVLPAAATACRALADECLRLSEVGSLLDQPRAALQGPGPDGQVQMLVDADGQRAPREFAERLLRLGDALALLTPRGRLE